MEPLSPKLKNNREAHVDYIRITKENADTLRDIVEQARTSNPLDNALAYACMYMKQIQELLVYVSDTCPSSPLKSEKLVAVTPMNKARKVTFAKTSTTSDNNTQIQVDVHQTQTTSKPLDVHQTQTTSKPLVPSKPRMNDRARAKAVKSIKLKEWKPTGKIFTSTKIVPPRNPVKSTVITNIKPSSASQWRPKETNHASSSSAPKIVESRTANHLEPNNHMGSNVSISTCSSTVQCRKLQNLLKIGMLVWGKADSETSHGGSKLEYKFQNKKNSEDIFSFGSAMEDFICVVFVPDRNIIEKVIMFGLGLKVGFHRNLQAGGEYEDKDKDFEDIRRSPYNDKDTEDIRRYS
ncbi:hypothetical protein Tco_1338853 [Tanacetum coccineum]